MKKDSRIILFGIALGILTVLVLEEPEKACRVLTLLKCKKKEKTNDQIK